MDPKVPFLGTLWISLILVNTVYLAVAALLFRRNAIPIEKIKLFFGPTLFTVVRGRTQYSLGCIPYGGFVKYEMETYAKSPVAVRIGTGLIPVGATVIIAMVLLGPAYAIRSVGSGFAQIIIGALHPSVVGVDLLSRLAGMNANPMLVAGIVAAKAVALSLLPAPVLPGGKWLVDIWDPKSETKAVELISTAAALALIGIHISWLIACLIFVWRT